MFYNLLKHNVLFLLSAFFIVSCASSSSPSIKEISAADAYQFQKSGKAVIVDVREENETSKGRVKDSVLLPMSLMNNNRAAFDQKVIELKKYPEVVLYCQSGRRAGIVGEELKKAGLKVHNLGGFESWKQKQLPTE